MAPSRVDPSRREGKGFSLVEMLVATAILSILALAMTYLCGQAGSIWSRAESGNQYRLQARTVLDYMGRELRAATLAPDRAAAIAAGKPTLQFLLSPANVAENYPGSLFWQAPVATDGEASGDLAEVGYFVRWTNGQGNLCRFFVNPSDAAHYQVYGQAGGQWVTDSLLSAVAPGDDGNNYQGLFLENVLGIWVQAYPAPLLSAVPCPLPYDSSSPPDPAHPLPSYVALSLVVLDPAAAQRLRKVYGTTGSSPPAPIAPLYSAATAQQFLSQLNASPVGPMVKEGASVVSLNVRLDNYR